VGISFGDAIHIGKADVHRPSDIFNSRSRTNVPKVMILRDLLAPIFFGDV